MQLTNFVDYGLRSLMYLAFQSDKLCTVKEISEYYDISHNHIVKVVHRLSQLGYITSSKGKGGGIKIAPHSFNLKIGDLIKELEPTMHLVECFNKDSNTCKITNFCQLKHYLYDANEAFIKSLNHYTLADAIKNWK
jgi:Rrf2 family nitric oxide-sensitive transcriptional repressor